MKNLITLVKMQISEKLNIKSLSFKGKSVFSILISVLVPLLKFALVTALCAVFMILAQYLGIFAQIGARIPNVVMNFIFSAMLLLSTVSCIVGLTKAMYYSKDNAVLLTLPCSSMQVYLSKLIIFFCFEVKKNFAFVVPLFTAYFIVHSYDWYFYPWMIVCFVFISLLTVSIAAMLSVGAMWIANIFRQRRLLQMILAVIALIAVAALLFFAISIIPEDLNLRDHSTAIKQQIRNFLDGFKDAVPPLYSITSMMIGTVVGSAVVLPLGETAITFTLLIVASIVLVVLGLLIVQPIFYTMASKPFEYLKKKVKPKKNRKRSLVLSSCYNEFLKIFKDSSKLFSNIGIMISVPVLSFFLNKMFMAMNTDELGDYMVVAFNVLIILLIVLNANTYAASVYSRDGRSAYLIKVQPTNPAILLVTKLLPGTVFCTISLVATFAVLCISTSLGVTNSLLLTLAIYFIYLAHLTFCAEQDIMNPQTEIYAAMGEHENDPNEAVATVTAFIIAFLVAGATMLLLIEKNSSPVFPKLMILSLGVLAYRVWIFLSKIKLYYKEK